MVVESKFLFIYCKKERMSGVQTEAVPIGDGLFKILPTPDYEPKDEIWEFPPGSIVRCETPQDDSGEYIFAVKQ